jgi:glycosyltransferase involved in cell wall biosynthesis
MELPKISLVTTSLNRREYLEQTLRSVLDQDYPRLEYIVIDGASTDGSVEIIRRWQHRLSYWTSEPDCGPYDALNKGFARSSGEIMGWLNCDDVLLPNAMVAVGEAFARDSGVEWITGLASTMDAGGRVYRVREQAAFKRSSFWLGPVRGIQQESTFWRRSLWDRAGSELNTAFRYAADYELWSRFFLHAALVRVPVALGAFRRHGRQITQERRAEYRAEVARIREQYRRRLTVGERIAGYVLLALELAGRRQRRGKP